MMYEEGHPDVSLSRLAGVQSVGNRSTISHCGGSRSGRVRLPPGLVRALGTRSSDCK